MILRAMTGPPLNAALAATFAYLTIHSVAAEEHPVYTLLYALLALEYIAALLARKR